MSERETNNATIDGDKSGWYHDWTKPWQACALCVPAAISARWCHARVSEMIAMIAMIAEWEIEG